MVKGSGIPNYTYLDNSNFRGACGRGCMGGSRGPMNLRIASLQDLLGSSKPCIQNPKPGKIALGGESKRG